MQTILLLDDDPMLLEAYEKILKMFGYTVITRPDASSALALIRGGTAVDLVVTDYRMPGMDGIEFVRVLKETAPFIPVIVVTSHMEVETYLKAVGIGALDCISKPARAKELEQIVKAALKGAKIRKAEPDDSRLMSSED